MEQGKNFVLTHNPFGATGTFLQEVNFLLNNGFSFVQNGQFWNAIR